ncbi:MAG TPA: inositol monophosphatase family protein [Solirubrobacteraceae bacterium]|nr:inositol monophosphatase family protein [Solirubrobacteraceae bacterium]
MNDVELAIALVREGAAIVRRDFGTTVSRLDKGGGDFATSTDVGAEAAMLAVLRGERPRDAVRGEESGQRGAGDSARRWLIDPLCGTLNYAAGMQVVAVNAALSTPDGVIAAAVADPFADFILWADRNSAWLRTGAGDSAAAPSSRSALVDLNLDPPFPNATRFRAVTLMAETGFAARFRPRVVSSTLAVAWVASGQRAAYVTDGDVRESVHFSAGIAICEAAGCVVTDLAGASWESGANGLIAAANQDAHAALIELVAEQLR